jgi:hypothetical protein
MAKGGSMSGRDYKRERRIASAAPVAVLCAMGICAQAAERGHPAIELTLPIDGKPVAMQMAADEILVRGADGAERVVAVTTQKSPEGVLLGAVDWTARRGEEAFAVLYPAGAARTESNRRVLTREILVQVEKGTSVEPLKATAGVVAVEALDFAPGAYLVRVAPSENPIEVAAAIGAIGGVKSAEPQLGRLMQQKAIPDDPLFPKQFNFNRKVNSPGADIQVIKAWDRNRGTGVVIGIADGGVQLSHPDLERNANVKLSRDFLRNRSGEEGVTIADAHATACGGLAAARGFNGIGITGAAPSAKLVSLRVLAASATPVAEAKMLTYEPRRIPIKSSSWGPADDGSIFQLPAILADALQFAGENGRSGRGVILIWAGGNGKRQGDDSNYDGYANSIYTIATGAVNPKGNGTYYSEPGANLVVSAPCDGRGYPAVTSTDRTGPAGYNDRQAPVETDYSDMDYTNTFGGTSAAAPQLAGVAALMIEANPKLGWRDVQEILMRTAVRNAVTSNDWIRNAAGFNFNHAFGAGVVHATHAVRTARKWKPLPSALVTEVQYAGGAIPIPDSSATGVTVTFDVVTAIHRAEHIVVEVDIEHSFRGDLDIRLIAPSGTSSRLALTRGDGGADYRGYPFMTVRNWGEDPNGTWRLVITDRASEFEGTLTGAKLIVRGTRETGF